MRGLATVALTGFALAALGCGFAREEPVPNPAAAVEGFEFMPLPPRERRNCHEHERLTSAVRCPAVFPRPTSATEGDWFIKPVKAGIGRDAARTGIDISFLPDARSARVVLHFSLSSAPSRDGIVGYGEDLPAGARPAVLNGRRGLYAEPTGEAPCCNHAIFVWEEAGRSYAASLHDLGADTRPLLEALLARLSDDT